MGFSNTNSAELRGGYFVTVSSPVDNRMVVDSVEDLYGESCVWDEIEEASQKKSPSYGNMLVSVAETNELYMLKSHYNEDKQKYEALNYKEKESWKKIGSDVATTKDIIINGGPIADAFNSKYPKYNGVLPSGMTFDEFVELLLCSESFPSTTTTDAYMALSISSPSITTSNGINNGNLVVVGSAVDFKSVTAPAVYEVTSSTVKPKVTGMSNGYATDFTTDAIVKDANGNIVKKIERDIIKSQSQNSNYKLSTFVSGFGGSYTTGATSSSNTNCIIGPATLTAGFGTNTYKISVSGCTWDYTFDTIPSYYIVSNLGKLDKERKTKELVGHTQTTNTPTNSTTFSVTGVYPIYHNISNGGLLDDTSVRMGLISGNLITLENIPSQSTLKKHFMLDFPLSKELNTSDSWIYDESGTKYPLTGFDLIEIDDKTINGASYKYQRFMFKDTRNGAIPRLEIRLKSNLNSK